MRAKSTATGMDAAAAWFGVGMDAWMLDAESSMVIGLRLARLAMGGHGAAREAALMVTEKVAAGLELQAGLLAAAPGLTPLSGARKTVRHYRNKVAANRRRLSR